MDCLPFFSAIDFSPYADSVCIIDVEGTIAFHGDSAVRPDAGRAIAALRQKTEIFLCSNAADPNRIARIAAGLGVGILTLTGPKPWGRLPAGFFRGSAAVTVFGDKCLTDGLFARRIGARFVRVRRLVSPRDGFLRTVIFTLDDYVARLLP